MRTTIQYRGNLSSSCLDAIQHQLIASERDTPFVFKGRGDVLNYIGLLVADLSNDPKSLDQSYTQVILDAPGAGKTALLRQLINRYIDDDSVLPIRMLGEELSTPTAFLKALVEGSRGSLAPELNSNRNRTGIRKVVSKVGLEALFGAGVERSQARPTPLEHLRHEDVWDLTFKALPRKVRKKLPPVLLLVDEAQRVGSDTSDGINPIVTGLHDARTGKLTILPVFAGLNDTRKRLEEVGLSRLTGESFTLGRLSSEEAEDVVRDTIDHPSLGMGEMFFEEDKSYVAKALAIASDQWPRHLHYYVKGFLGELVRDYEREQPIYQVDLLQALEYGHNARVQYYQDRVDLIRDSNFRKVLFDAFLKDNPPDRITKTELANNASSDQFEVAYRSAIHTGLLSPISSGQDEVCEVPIPSLKTFLQNNADHEATKQILRNTLELELDNETE